MTPSGIEPAWILQARAVFAEFESAAILNEYKESVWTGKLQSVFFKHAVPNNNRTRILKLLRELGVIEIRQRGNRHQQTVIVITGELQPISSAEPLLPPEHLTEPRHGAMLIADNLAERVERLEAWRESLEKGGLDLAEVVRDFELRITRLESQTGRK
jgi:hypothetical protein